MGFIDWFRKADRWLDTNIWQPVGRWGGAVWKGLTGQKKPKYADPYDVATNAGYQSGEWIRDWGLPLIEVASAGLAPGVAAGIEEAKQGLSLATGHTFDNYSRGYR